MGGAVALITGRSLDSVDQLFRDVVIAVAGQHGSERRAIDGRVHTHANSFPGRARLHREFAYFARQHPGLLFEDKGSTLALHYRLKPDLGPLVEKVMHAALRDLPPGEWMLQAGKFVVELRPSGRDKGTAILEFLAEAPFKDRVPVFVGDDLSDEYGFAAVAGKAGWGVKVGRGPTVARYRLPDVAAVRGWLFATVDGVDDSNA